MTSSPYDKKAVTILCETYWSATGWRANPVTAPEDRAYAIAQGVMFEPARLDHDRIVTLARALVSRARWSAVSDGFLASLTTRQLAYRSALGSLATCRWLPEHTGRAERFSFCCSICGQIAGNDLIDLSCLNFERLKWGGVRHLDPGYAWLDLSQFEALPPVEPQEADRKVFRKILGALDSLPRDARPKDAEKAISGLFPSNSDERRNLLQILGYCGILQPSAHPGFLLGYVAFDDRAQPAEWKNDWSYPFLFWRGSDGVNAEAVKLYFPDL
jgi:hypothetical protein